MHRYIPSRQHLTRSSDPSWWTPDCSRAVKSKERLWKLWQRNPQDRVLKANFVLGLKHCITELYRARSSQQMRLRTKLTKGNLRDKQWWQAVKRVGGVSKGSEIPMIIDSSGREHVNAKEKADVFAKHFSDKCSLGKNDITAGSSPHTPRPCSSKLCNIHFRVSEVQKILSKLDTSKASGPDGIPCQVLKACAEVLAEPITALFRLVFRSGVQPTSWKLARVVPIHKRSSQSLAKNYRPVSLLSVLSKVFESIVNQQLMNYLERHHILTNDQYGFRRGLGTADLLTALHHQWSTIAGSGGAVRVLAIDIAGAFDKVSHAGLLIKLQGYGVEGKLLAWLTSYLSGRQLQAVVDGATSACYPISAGVPQGSILGPTMLIIYTNDLEDVLPPGVDVAVYADDTTLCTAISTQDRVATASQKLQQAVDAVHAWGRSWRITFEPTKSQSMVVTNRRTPLPFPSISFGGLPVTEDEHVKLLGVDFDHKLSFRGHLRSVAVRANQRLAFLRRAAKALDTRGLVSVYKGFIRPVLEYAPLVWMGAAPTHLQRLDQVQHRALKVIGGNTVLQSLHFRRVVSGLVYLYKLQCLPGPPMLLNVVPPLAHPVTEPRTRRQSAERHNLQLLNELPCASNDLLRRSFPYGIIHLWNSLPPSSLLERPSLKNLQAFKEKVNSHLSQEPWAWDMI